VTTLHRPYVTRVRGPVELLALQLHAMDLWHEARRATERAADMPGLSPEARLDAGRRIDVRRREHEAMLERLAVGDDDTGCCLPTSVPTRAVVALRHIWARDSLSGKLMQRGLRVLCAPSDGAEAVGVCVAEQPDLLVVGELLAMPSGPSLISEVTRFCPRTVVVGYVRDESAVGDLLEAGAHTVCTWRMPPDDMAQTLAEIVR
jgi:hypothetical protein